MNNILKFLSNYKKIILGSFLIFLIYLSIMVVAFLNLTISEFNTKNLERLEMIADESDKVFGLYDEYYNAGNSANAADLNVLCGIFQLHPEDLFDQNLIDQYCKALTSVDNLIVLDENLNRIHSYGELRKIDYKDSYYKALFTNQSDLPSVLYDKDGSECWSVSKKCGNYFLVVQADKALSRAECRGFETVCFCNDSN